MPLLSTSQITAVLKKERLSENGNPLPFSKDPKAHLRRLLDDANLSPEEILENLSSQMRSAESDAVRLGAAKVALQMQGMLSDENNGAQFNVVININDSEYVDVNPILIPR